MVTFKDGAAGGTPLNAANLNTLVSKGELAANVRDYRLAADTTDSGAITRAHAANKVVLYANGKNHDTGFYQNLYGGTYQNAIGPRYMAGRSGSPVADAEPIIWAQKYSSADRATNAGEWDNGAGYFALHKESGNAYGAGLTGYARHASVTGGQVIGVHGRAHGVLASSEVWGGWSYVFNATNIVPQSMIGHEINMVNKAPDQGWMATPTTGQSRGLVVVTADGSNPVTEGVYIGANNAAPSGFIHTGLHIEGDGIMPSAAAISSTAVANNEAIRLDGATSAAGGSTGFRFYGGFMRTGISFTETTFENGAAILVGDNQRIVVGTGPGSTTYLNFNKTTSSANFNNMNIAIGGNKVVGTRKLGWGAPTGTVSRAAFDTATVTHQTLAQIVAALLLDLGAATSTGNHGLIGA